MLTKFGLTRKSKKNTVLKAVIILGVGEAHTFTCVTCVRDWSRASCFPCAGISWVTCCSSSSTRPLVKQLVLKDLCIPVPSTSQRLQERRSGEFISRAREQCTVHRITKVSLWRKKTVQGPLNRVSEFSFFCNERQSLRRKGNSESCLRWLFGNVSNVSTISIS